MRLTLTLFSLLIWGWLLAQTPYESTFQTKITQLSDQIITYNQLVSRTDLSEYETVQRKDLQHHIKKELYASIDLMTKRDQSQELYMICLKYNADMAVKLKAKAEQIFDYYQNEKKK